MTDLPPVPDHVTELIGIAQYEEASVATVALVQPYASPTRRPAVGATHGSTSPLSMRPRKPSLSRQLLSNLLKNSK